jgi:NAD-dependent SIR2 family protein deacetylase
VACAGAHMKTSIINFGENLDEAVLDGAWKAGETGDFCLVLGSSLTVSPVNAVSARVSGQSG